MRRKFSGLLQNVIRVAVVAGLLWGILYVVGSPARPPDPAHTGRVSVLSYNIQADSTRWDETADAILAANTDVVCLQEVGPSYFSRLNRKLRHQYPGTLYRDAHYGFGGLAFFSKYELRDLKYIPDEGDAWFPAWIVQAETPAGPVQILQVHLRPRVADVGGKVVGHFTTGPIHRREMSAYFDQLDAAAPTFIVGDFNEGTGAPAVRFLEERGFTNALPLFDRDSHTWQGPVWRVNIKSRIDHVLFSHQFECTSARVIHGGGSDHLPVYGAFQRRDASPNP